MALSYYDPLTDMCLSSPCHRDHRDRWGVCRWEPLTSWEQTLVPKGLMGARAPLWRNPATEIVSDKDKFQVTLPMGDFKSNEVHVKLVDRSLNISAEHEEKPDDHGHIYRRITRRYFLPRNVDCDNLKATFSDNGTLVVCAQKKAIEAGSERQIEVEKLAPSSHQQVSKETEKETGKGTKIPVSHETAVKV